MKAIIIEDERPALEKLKNILAEVAPYLTLLGEASSVKSAIDLLKLHHHELDVVFSDIKLKDGLSLEIFKEHPLQVPIIFITAYDHYALDAFRANGIDYLLKPVEKSAVEQSLNKLKNLRKEDSRPTVDSLEQALKSLLQKEYKTRFMVKVGEHIRSVKSEEVAFFYADGRNAFIVTNNKARYSIDYKMETLEEILDPRMFYRVNRTYIINIEAIKDVLIYSVTRLRIVPAVEWKDEIVVSREKVSAFKDWFNDTR